MSKKSDKLNSALKEIRSKYGEDVIHKGNEKDFNVRFLSTGIAALDQIMSGGVAEGRIHEFYGVPSSGKSTVCLKIIKNAQDSGYNCAYIDSEKAYDPTWAKTLGVDTENLIYIPFSKAENVFDIIRTLIKTKDVKLIIVDSVAALTPQKELENDIDKLSVAEVARIISKGLRIMNTENEVNGTTTIFINQLRSKIGVFFGSPDVTPGGRALGFYSTSRVNFRRGKDIKEKDNPIGYTMHCRVEKNKVGIPKLSTEFPIMNDGHIDKEEMLVTVASTLGYWGENINLTGRTYTYKAEKVASSKDDFIKYLKANPKVCEEMEKDIVTKARK